MAEAFALGAQGLHVPFAAGALLCRHVQAPALAANHATTTARIQVLAAEFGTPVLVVDETALRQRARDYLAAFRSRWPLSDVAFASKAFPCTAIQRLMVEEGLHLDVAGGGEIMTALAAGADPARMVLHGNAKTDEELQMAVQHGVGLVVVDNFDDIDRLERIVPPGHRQACLVRVIPGVTASTYAAVATGHAGSKFGLLPEDARVAIDRIRASRVLRCDGVHTHVGSQLMQVDQLAAAVEDLIANPDQWELLAAHPELAPAAVEELVRDREALSEIVSEAVPVRHRAPP